MPGLQRRGHQRLFSNYHWNTSDVTIRLGRSENIEYHNTHDEEDWSVTMIGHRADDADGRTPQTGTALHRGRHLSVDLRRWADQQRHQRQHRVPPAAQAIITVTAVQPAGRFGDLTIEGSQITAFTEKPEQEAAYINGGFFVVDKRIGDYLPGDSTVLENEPMNTLVREGQICAYQHPGFWQCMDTYREQQMLSGMWQADKAPWKTW